MILNLFVSGSIMQNIFSNCILYMNLWIIQYNILCPPEMLVMFLRSLWCGGSEGIMSVFTLRHDGLVLSQDTISHFNTSTPPSCKDSSDVLILHTPQNLATVSPHLRSSVWSYVYPGIVCVNVLCFCVSHSTLNSNYIYTHASSLAHNLILFPIPSH